MNLVLVGTNHKYSPIEIRERISFSKKRLKDALNFLKQNWILKGAVILSTCNRVEIYASTRCLDLAKKEVVDFISHYHEIERLKINPYLYIYEEKEAARHLFGVSSGLDSQILGETQILSQVKFSFEEACVVNFTDEILIKIFSSAISFAKEIHKKTKISEGKISIGTVAIDFIKEKLGPLTNKNILIIGVGKVTELVLKYLKRERSNVVFISNRTFEKAKELASQIGAQAVRFDNLKQFLKEADIVISATASPHFIIKKEMLNANQAQKPVLLIDLAVPRDIDPQVKLIRNVSLYSLEDLDSVIRRNVERKEKEARNIKELINIEVEKLWERLTKLEPAEALLP